MVEARTQEQILEHYEIEKELAGKLRNANAEERKKLYNILYDELFQRVPHHPQHIKDNQKRAYDVNIQYKLLKKYISCNTDFVEIGPGDCALSFHICNYARKVFAVDVSKEITNNKSFPENFQLIISDGTNIPLPEQSIDVIFSDQLMEHLHKDDALEQISNIHKVLKSEGRYICITPNRLNGPHDVSRHFDSIATGFHLKEYTNKELTDLFKSTGFRKVKTIIGTRGLYIPFPLWIIILFERILSYLPAKVAKKISSFTPFKILLGIKIIAIK